jgi:hypothetical protein
METHNPGHAAAAAQSYYEQQAKIKGGERKPSPVIEALRQQSQRERDDGPRRAAEEILEVLETPIAGIPSVEVVCRSNALRLLEAAFKTLWDANRPV